MDATAVIDIQYAIVALNEIRCGPPKILRKCMISMRTYRSQLNAFQRELRSIAEYLEILSNEERPHVVEYPRWKELTVPKWLADRAKSSVMALDDAIDFLREDIDLEPCGMSADTKVILEGARVWNDELLEMLEEVTPRDGDFRSLNHSNLLSFYDTMWNLEQELAELGTELAVIGGGMTVKASQVLLNVENNPHLVPDQTEQHSEIVFSNPRPSPAVRKIPRIPQSIPIHGHPRPHGNSRTLNIETKQPRATVEHDPAVSPPTLPKLEQGIQHAKNSLDLRFKFPPQSNSKDHEPKVVRSRIPVATLKLADKTSPRYTQAPRPHQVPLPAHLEDDHESFREQPDNRPPVRDHRARRNAIADLPCVPQRAGEKYETHPPYIPQHTKDHIPHVNPPTAPKPHPSAQSYNKIINRSPSPSDDDIDDIYEIDDDDHDDNVTIFTIDTSMQQELNNFRERKRARAAVALAAAIFRAANPETKTTRHHSPRPSSSVSQLLEQPELIIPPPPTEPRTPRRTLPELGIETQGNSARGSRCQSPTADDFVKPGIVCQQPKPTVPPPTAPKTPRRTLPDLVIASQTKSVPGVKYHPPMTEDVVQLGPGKGKGKGKKPFRQQLTEEESNVVSPTTTTLEALKKMDARREDRRVGGKKVIIVDWRDEVVTRGKGEKLT